MAAKPVEIPYEPVEWRVGYFIRPDGKLYQGKYGQKIEKTDENGNTTWDKPEEKTLICDGYAYIHKIIEPIGDDSNIFVLKVKPVHNNEIELKIKATDASEKRKLTAELVNAFGVDDIGSINLSIIKRMSRKDLEYIKLLNKPQWLNGKICAPGLDIQGAQFNFMRNVVVDFNTNGDAKIGVSALENIIKAFDPVKAIIAVVTYLASPVVANLWPGDRYYLFIQGTTGSRKTAAIMVLGSLYGQGYNYEANILRWGGGTTGNAASHVAAQSGPFPFTLDNFKSYTRDDAADFQRMIHAICEGAEKARMQKDSSDLRKSEEFLCIPIITGENYPGQDPATIARGIILNNWTITDLDQLTIAQSKIADLNALGRSWCLWLSSDQGKAAMKEIALKFVEVRSKYIQQADDAFNSGRIGANAAIIDLIWQLLGMWDVTADFVKQHNETLNRAIDEHILATIEDINSSTEADKFISWLNAEIELGKYYIHGLNNSLITNTMMRNNSIAIGHYKDDEILIKSNVLLSTLLPEWQKTTSGVRTDGKSLKAQLHQRGYIKYNTAEKEYAFNRGSPFGRVLVFNLQRIIESQGSMAGLTAVPGSNASVTGVPGTKNLAQAD